MIECPTNEELIIYADNPDELTFVFRIAIQEHLRKCRDCRFKVLWARDDFENVDGDV